MKHYFYKIYGVKFKVITDSSEISAAIALLFCNFEDNTNPTSTNFELRFKKVENKNEIPLQVSSSCQAITSYQGGFWSCSFYRLMNLKIIDFGEDGIIFIDYQRKQVEGYLVKPNVEYPEILANFFFIALSELLKTESIYGLHAAALEKDGYGFLIPAASGSGKTTCTTSLIRSGYNFISEDHVFLLYNNNQFEILPSFLNLDNRLFLEYFFKKSDNRTGIPTINATEKTIRLFPELKNNKGYPYQNPRKRYFFIDDIYPGTAVNSCKPNFIIFPKIVNYSKSYLEPLPKSRALEEILPEGFFVFDRDTAKKQFHTLSSLIQSSECYRFYFGEDVLEIPNIFDTLIAKS